MDEVANDMHHFKQMKKQTQLAKSSTPRFGRG